MSLNLSDFPEIDYGSNPQSSLEERISDDGCKLDLQEQG